MQIIRIHNRPDSFFERTVLADQSLFFEASPHDQLEVHTYAIAGAIFTDTVSCASLQTPTQVTPRTVEETPTTPLTTHAA